MERFPSRSWAEIDLDILANNMREIRRITSQGAEVMAVVKADAYGHGAIQVARLLLENGASRLAVSMLDEAIELRKHGIDAPILTLGHIDPRRAPEVISNNLEQTVYSVEYAEAISEQAAAAGKKIRIHIKHDSGMNRVGFLSDQNSVKDILRIAALPGIAVEGLFSHFSSADQKEEDAYTRQQFSAFSEMAASLEREGLCIPRKHICNSAALLRFPEMHLDLVRAGLVIYGMIPKGCPPPYTEVDLHPAMTLKSSIVHVKTLPAGQSISYGRRFSTKKDSVIATIPIGYADGYARRLSNRSSALLRGQLVPVVGNICMDMCMLDVSRLTEIPSVSEEVVLFGQQNYQGRKYDLPVDEVADLLDTINYEITCLIGKRVPRVYIRNGEIVHMHSCIW